MKTNLKTLFAGAVFAALLSVQSAAAEPSATSIMPQTLAPDTAVIDAPPSMKGLLVDAGGSDRVTLSRGVAIGCGRGTIHAAARVLIIADKFDYAAQNFDEEHQRQHAEQARLLAQGVVRGIANGPNWPSLVVESKAPGAYLNHQLENLGYEISKKSGIHTLLIAPPKDVILLAACPYLLKYKGILSWEAVQTLDRRRLVDEPAPRKPHAKELQASYRMP